jgi:hypothetical protein
MHTIYVKYSEPYLALNLGMVKKFLSIRHGKLCVNKYLLRIRKVTVLFHPIPAPLPAGFGIEDVSVSTACGTPSLLGGCPKIG